MASLRNITVDRSDDSRQDGYLDAARECILDVGWRRTTLTEVARRAGVSRMTIYRTWSDMPSLLGDLMTREWGRIAGGLWADESTVGGDTVDRIAETTLRAVEALRDNELFVRIVELDPELLLPYLLARRGRTQEHLVSLLAQTIEAGQRAGEVRPGDPVTMARALTLAGHGFVLSAHTMVDDRVSEEALADELRRLVAGSLR